MFLFLFWGGGGLGYKLNVRGMFFFEMTRCEGEDVFVLDIFLSSRFL